MELLLHSYDLCFCFERANIHETESKNTWEMFVLVY